MNVRLGFPVLSIGLFFLSLSYATAAEVSAQPSDAPLIAWIKEQAKPIQLVDVHIHDTDLDALNEVVGNASIVGFGEHTHGLHEPNQLKLRFFRHLVEKKKFRAIVLESGILEGRIVENYIHGRTNLPLKEVLKQGFTHGMGLYEENKALVEWMKAYNESHSDPTDKIHFYGLDLSLKGDAPSLPLSLFQNYLKKVDPKFFEGTFGTVLSLAKKADEVIDQVECYYKNVLKLPLVEPDNLDGFTSIGFEQLSQDEQRALETGIKGVINHIHAYKFEYIKVMSEEEYDWHAHLPIIAYQMIRDFRSRQAHPKIAGFDTAVEITRRALGERFTEAFKKKINLAHIPSNPPTLEGLEDYIRGRGESRELAEAENVGWIQRQNGKVLVYEANGHLQKAPKDIRVGPLDVGKIEEVAGTYLMREYGNDFVLIGSTVNSFVDPVTGETLTKLEGVPIAPTESCKDCLERPLAQAAKELAFPLFLIDLRSAGGAALDAIDRDRENRFGHGGFQRFNSYEAYDALVFFDKASLGITLISCIKRSVNGQLHLNPTCL